MTTAPDDAPRNTDEGGDSLSYWRSRFRTFGHMGYNIRFIYDYDEPLRLRGVLKVLKSAGLASFEGLRALDIGCGTGSLALELARIKASVIGIEPVREAIIEARRRVRKAAFNADFIEGRAENLPFLKETFDLVTSVTVFQHIKEETQFLRSVAETVAVLRDGGHVLLLELAASKEGMDHPSPAYIKIRSRQSYITAFEQLGCRLVKEVKLPEFGILTLRWLRKLGWPTVGRVWPTGLVMAQKVILLLTGPLDKALLGSSLVPSDTVMLVFTKRLEPGPERGRPKDPLAGEQYGHVERIFQSGASSGRRARSEGSAVALGESRRLLA